MSFRPVSSVPGDCLAMGTRATSASGLADSVVLSWRLEYRKQLRGREALFPSRGFDCFRTSDTALLSKDTQLAWGGSPQCPRPLLPSHSLRWRRSWPPNALARDRSRPAPGAGAPATWKFLQTPLAVLLPRGPVPHGGGRGAQTKGPAGPNSLGPVPTLPDTALAPRLSPVWPLREAGAHALRLGSLAGPVVPQEERTGVRTAELKRGAGSGEQLQSRASGASWWCGWGGGAASELGRRALWPRVLGACRQGSVLGSGAGGRQGGTIGLRTKGQGSWAWPAGCWCSIGLCGWEARGWGKGGPAWGQEGVVCRGGLPAKAIRPCKATNKLPD